MTRAPAVWPSWGQLRGLDFGVWSNAHATSKGQRKNAVRLPRSSARRCGPTRSRADSGRSSSRSLHWQRERALQPTSEATPRWSHAALSGTRECFDIAERTFPTTTPSSTLSSPRRGIGTRRFWPRAAPTQTTIFWHWPATSQKWTHHLRLNRRSTRRRSPTTSPAAALGRLGRQSGAAERLTSRALRYTREVQHEGANAHADPLHGGRHRHHSQTRAPYWARGSHRDHSPGPSRNAGRVGATNEEVKRGPRVYQHAGPHGETPTQ
jgi:hypothetical protein